MSNLSEQIMQAGRAQALALAVRQAGRDAAEGKLNATLTTEANFRVPENSDVPNWPVIRAERVALEKKLRDRRARLTSLTTNLDNERWYAVADIVEAIRWKNGPHPGTLSLGNGLVELTPQPLVDYVFAGDKGPKVSELVGIIKRALTDEIPDVYAWIKDNHGLDKLYRNRIAKRQMNPRARGSGKETSPACTVPSAGDVIGEAPSVSALKSEEQATSVTERQYSLTLGDGIVDQSVTIPSGSDAAAITKAVTGLMRTLALADHTVMVVGQFFIAAANGDGGEDDGEGARGESLNCAVNDPRATNWQVRRYDKEWGWEPHSDHASLDEAVAAVDALRAEFAAAVEPAAEPDCAMQSEPVACEDEAQPPAPNDRLSDDEPKRGIGGPRTDRPDVRPHLDQTEKRAQAAHSPPSGRHQSGAATAGRKPANSSGHADGGALTCDLGQYKCAHHKLCRQNRRCMEAKNAAD